jgi:hypothetical protein
VLSKTREWSARVREHPSEEAWLGYAEFQEQAAAAMLAARAGQQPGQRRRRASAAVAATAAAVAEKRLSVLAAGLGRFPWSGRLLLASLTAAAEAGSSGQEEGGADADNPPEEEEQARRRWERALERRAIEASAFDGFGCHISRTGVDGVSLRREWQRQQQEQQQSGGSDNSPPQQQQQQHLHPTDDPYACSAWPVWRSYLALRRRGLAGGAPSPAALRALYGRAVEALRVERSRRWRDANRHRQQHTREQQLAGHPCPGAHAAERAATRIDEQLAQLTLMLARDEMEAGCGEAAVLRLQAAIEGTFFQRSTSTANRSAPPFANFERYWRSGVPRVGEPGGEGGWRAWVDPEEQRRFEEGRRGGRGASADDGGPAAEAEGVESGARSSPRAPSPSSQEPSPSPPPPPPPEPKDEAAAAGAAGDGWTGWWPAAAPLPPPPPPESEPLPPPPPPPPPPDEDREGREPQQQRQEEEGADDEDEMELVLEMGVRLEEALEEARRRGLSREQALELARRERAADARAGLRTDHGGPLAAGDDDDSRAEGNDDDDEDERAALDWRGGPPCASFRLVRPTLRAHPYSVAGQRRLLLGALELFGLGPELLAAAPSESGCFEDDDDANDHHPLPASWAPSNAPAAPIAPTATPWYLASDARWLFLVRLLSALVASPNAPCVDCAWWSELGFALVHLHFRRPSLLLLQRLPPAAAAASTSASTAAVEAGRAAARALMAGRRDDLRLWGAYASAEARAASASAGLAKPARRALEKTLSAACGKKLGDQGDVAAHLALQYADALMGWAPARWRQGGGGARGEAPTPEADRAKAATALACALAELPFDARRSAVAAGGDDHPLAPASIARARIALDRCLGRVASHGNELDSNDEAVVAASAALEELLLVMRTDLSGQAAQPDPLAVHARVAASVPVARRAACARLERLAVRHAQAAWRCAGIAAAEALTRSLLALYPCNGRLWRLLLMQEGQRPAAMPLLRMACWRLPARAGLWQMLAAAAAAAAEGGEAAAADGARRRRREVLERALRLCRGGAAERLAFLVEEQEEQEEQPRWPAPAALSAQAALAPDDWASTPAPASELAALWSELLSLASLEQPRAARFAALGAAIDCPGNKRVWLRSLELLASSSCGAQDGGGGGRQLQALVDGARQAGGGEEGGEDAIGCRSRLRLRVDVVSLIAEEALKDG